MTFVSTHKPCDDCGSSDALSIDDKGWSTCFACNRRKPPGGNNIVQIKPTTLDEGDYRPIQDRRISSATCKLYKAAYRGTDLVFNYTNAAGHIVAQKIKTPDKRFSTAGSWTDAVIYGQSLFSSGGKYVTVVEGELDALAAYQMMGSKWPVVSVKNGAGSALKDCKDAYEWLNGFDNIVICFDADEPGRKAAAQVAELFGGKSKVVRHRAGMKDACDYLSSGNDKEFMDSWWSAEQYVPDGIIQGSSLYEEVMKDVAPADVMYPFDELNKLTYGMRKGELVTITAGSGLGKSQFVREIVWHVMNKVPENVGLLFLEESARKTGLSLMSLAANKPLHLPDSDATLAEKQAAFDVTLGSDRLYLLNHFGSTSVDNIVSRVRYMAKALDCGYIFLDHISIVVSAQSNGDERRAIDEIMTKLRMLVQETGIALVCVSHLKRPDGKGHEEGTATSLSQLRGSGSIAQLSDMVIGLERNGQAEDLNERHTTKVRVLKNRHSGLTGPAGRLLYSQQTGRMLEVKDEEDL
jgi:twinkle protein